MSSVEDEEEDFDLANELEAAFEEQEQAEGSEGEGVEEIEEADEPGNDPTKPAADMVKFMSMAGDMMDEDYDSQTFNPTPAAPSSEAAAPLDSSTLLGQQPQPGMASASAYEFQLLTEDPTARKKEEIFNSLTEEQKDRYEAFMRSSLPKPKIKKLMQHIIGGPVPEKAAIAMSGICKLHLGEIIETAREMARLDGHKGPLMPRHVRRAYQELQCHGRIPHFRHQAKKRRVMTR